MAKTAADQAGYVYSSCFEEIRAVPNGDDWDVFDGADGPHVATVPTAVLHELNNSYDMPVLDEAGDYWDG